jgi:hypothetical protein
LYYGIHHPSIPFNVNLKDAVEARDLVSSAALLPPDVLSDVFQSGLAKRTIHIVVDRPPSGEFWPYCSDVSS